MPEPAEVEPVARAQHVHREREQHAGHHGGAENQAARKKGRLSHTSLVGWLRAIAQAIADGIARTGSMSEMQVSEAQRVSATSYAYKASLIGSAHRFELTDEGLSWHIPRRSGVWRYDEISAIRLSFRPVSMQQHR